MNSRSRRFVPILISEGAQARPRLVKGTPSDELPITGPAQGMEAMTEPMNQTIETHEDQIASMIRPLPENVVPSDRFLHQMRERLLRLEAATRPATKRAA
jgi:hypothetical protein